MPAPRFLARSLEPVLRRSAREFPALVLTGPRQSGKTTLLRRLFARTHRYVSLEPPDARLAAERDPRGFLAAYPPPVVFDEVQHAPGLFPYIKERIDEERQRAGRYVLTGSQDLLLIEKVTESLAGRTAVLRLLPLSARELSKEPSRPLPWESARRPSRPWPRRRLWEQVLRGGYPELTLSPRRSASAWHAAFIQTYLERDVRSLRQVGDLTTFQVFLRALAAQHGQLLDLTHLAGSIGAAVNTVKAWLSVLEATHQVIILRPYFANLRKRLVKTPKVYFTDPGTVCYLVGLRDAEHAAAGPMAGALFEGLVVSEVYKTLLHRGEVPRVHFWRTSDGHEVDVVVEHEGRLVPIEAKAAATPRPAMAGDVRLFGELFGPKALPGYVVHAGTQSLPLGGGVTALPFGDL